MTALCQQGEWDCYYRQLSAESWLARWLRSYGDIFIFICFVFDVTMNKYAILCIQCIQCNVCNVMYVYYNVMTIVSKGLTTNKSMQTAISSPLCNYLIAYNMQCVQILIIFTNIFVSFAMSNWRGKSCSVCKGIAFQNWWLCFGCWTHQEISA